MCGWEGRCGTPGNRGGECEESRGLGSGSPRAALEDELTLCIRDARRKSLVSSKVCSIEDVCEGETMSCRKWDWNVKLRFDRGCLDYEQVGSGEKGEEGEEGEEGDSEGVAGMKVETP